MPRILHASLLVVLVWLPSLAAAQPAARAAAGGAVMFVGSSTFHRWADLEKQMEPLPIVNRAVDGLYTGDILRMIDPVVVPARPRVVGYYAGSNDVSAGDSADAIFARIRQFVDRVSTALPDTQIVFVSMNRAPEKRHRWDAVDAINRRVAAYATESKNLQYVDVNRVLFTADGSPRLDFYMPDQLHLRPAAYVEFARILKPVLTYAFSGP
jgi:lysophospholipase L1-like esterase